MAYLEHLQTVFRQLDVNVMISEPVLICFFRNSLQHSICTQAKQDGYGKDT